ncbi:MAG TPA: DUF3313 domain-containing protein [Nitrospiria bacterium]|nr:DUF3313 domain-containing protein [Nitrospiria bacterium]
MRKLVILILAVAVLSGCAATTQMRTMEPSGFLGEYRSLLKPGKDVQGVHQVILIYIKPNLNIASYHKILLAPITIWDDPNHPMSIDDRNDLVQLADSETAQLSDQLSKAGYDMVDKFGPDTLRIQAAIIHGQPQRVGLAFISRIVPQARALNTLWSFASGKPAFTGDVHIEVKITDGATGELLAAGGDARAGTLKLFDKNVFSSWGDVKNAFTYWNELLIYRLCTYSQKTDCVKPSA